MSDDFCIFILTHGRPLTVVTDLTLRRAGYTGDIFYVLDDEDATVAQYREKYGDKVIVFSKKDAAKITDTCDPRDDRVGVVFARNAVFGIAERLGRKWFLVLDDDYTTFEFRIDSDHQYTTRRVRKSMDEVIAALLEFYQSVPAKSVAIAQGGDFMGGRVNPLAKHPGLIRKCMNSFFCCTDRPFKFIGRMNEDVTTYVVEGTRGMLFFTVPLMTLSQKTTQSNPGGLTDQYLDEGTYVKSFMTVVNAPSCVKVGAIGDTRLRLHHIVQWNHAVPKIIHEGFRKP